MKTMELWEFCEENILDEKIFIVPTRAIGLHMINKIAREGHPILDLKPITLERLAFEICQEYIEKNEIIIIDNILGSNLIIQILKDLSQKHLDQFFFKNNLIDIETAEEVYKIILELKYAGVKEFPQEKDLDIIHKTYENRLKKLNAMDYYDVLAKASGLDTVNEGEQILEVCEQNLKMFQQKKIAIAYNIEFEDIEKFFLDKIIEDNYTRIKMPVSIIEDHPNNYYFKNSLSIDKAEVRSINFYESYGARNEIDYIIKDIYKKNIPLDEVVIAYTNNKYVNLLNIEFENRKIPIGFGQGLSVESSSTYRFINTLFSWATNHYNLDEIRPIFINRDINIQKKYDTRDGSISPSAMYEELVLSRVLHGRDNYYKVLTTDRYNVDKRYLGPYSKDRREWLQKFFNDVFQALPTEGHIKFKDYIPSLISLIERYVRNLNKYDGAAQDVILKTLEQIETIDMEVSRSEYFDIILSYIEKERVIRAQAQPGHIFATSYRTAGYTGRKHLYLIGLDSDSLSNKTMESPILLDRMRKEIADNLSISNESYKYKKYKIRELLTADFQNISIGYSNFDTIDVKVQAPSQIYTELKDYYNQARPQASKWALLGKDLVKSGTALEVLADCSRKAYLRYKVDLKPKDEIDIRVDRWLEPLDRGNIVHHVLSEFFKLEEEKQDLIKLRELVEEECNNIKEEVPYILYEVYLREKQEIFDTCKNIVDITMKDDEWEILVNELSFGRGEDNERFGKLPRQKVSVGGLELEISGSIDRIDVHKENQNLIRIVDYKTGRKSNFEKKLRERLGRGRNASIDYSQTQKFQYYIYKKALEKILESRTDIIPNPEIENFIYIFGDEEKNPIINLEFSKDFIEEIETRITDLLNLDIFENDKTIIYDPEDRLRCTYCDYASICIVDENNIQEELEV